MTGKKPERFESSSQYNSLKLTVGITKYYCLSPANRNALENKMDVSICNWDIIDYYVPNTLNLTSLFINVIN